LSKIAENCDHNIDPWSPCFFPKLKIYKIDRLQATKLDVGAIHPGDPYDPFGGTTSGQYSGGFGADEAFGSGSFMPPVPQSTPAFARRTDNDFGQSSMADNPFLVK
jgi:hypothetical protein